MARGRRCAYRWPGPCPHSQGEARWRSRCGRYGHGLCRIVPDLASTHDPVQAAYIKVELDRITATLGSMDIRRVNPDDVLDDLRKRYAARRSARNTTYKCARAFFSWAAGRAGIKSPCAKLKRPSEDHIRDRVLDDDEIRIVGTPPTRQGCAMADQARTLIASRKSNTNYKVLLDRAALAADAALHASSNYVQVGVDACNVWQSRNDAGLWGTDWLHDDVSQRCTASNGSDAWRILVADDVRQGLFRCCLQTRPNGSSRGSRTIGTVKARSTPRSLQWMPYNSRRTASLYHHDIAPAVRLTRRGAQANWLHSSRSEQLRAVIPVQTF